MQILPGYDRLISRLCEFALGPKRSATIAKISCASCIFAEQACRINHHHSGRAIAYNGLKDMLTVVDDFTRECVALVADTSLSGLRVGRELDAAIARRGRPRTIVSDNGTEFTSMAILRWSQETQIEWHFRLWNSA